MSDPFKPFVIQTNASATTTRAILLQDNHPIAFESIKLNPVQCSYLAFECKLLAIIHALKQWRHYLYGTKFEVVFDHESIKWFSTQKDLRGCKARWAEILQNFDCQLWYCKS